MVLKTSHDCVVLLFIVSCDGSYVRLVNEHPMEAHIIKDTISTGIVEMCLNGEYHTICDENWDNKAASVLCREIGFSEYGIVKNR